ncbi:hypothetical protein GS495_15230, partial [Rhodococcus hoagii]|nr:hypothetical protein [Prescottella equi]
MLPSAGRSELITYVSQNAQGDPVVVSGTVSIPRTPAPDGGWPVLSWAHGTTGVSDICAPSNDTADGPAHDYLGGVDAVLDRYVADGYVVVQTDYVGMGTPAATPTWTVARRRTRWSTSSAPAGRSTTRSAISGTRWGTARRARHLFTAAQGSERAPELDLRGAVAIAPGNETSATPQYLASGDPAVAPALAFLPLILLGAEAADPSIVADSYVTPESQVLLTAARTGCVGQIRNVIGSVPVDKAFAPGADIDKLVTYLKKQSLGQLTLTVPTLVLQGTADTLIAEPAAGSGRDVVQQRFRGRLQDVRGCRSPVRRAAVVRRCRTVLRRLAGGEKRPASARTARTVPSTGWVPDEFALGRGDDGVGQSHDTVVVPALG